MENYAVLSDFYEFTMSQVFFDKGLAEEIATFEMFFRKIPDGGGFAIMAGVEQLVEYFNNLKFSPEDIEKLREQGIFKESFLKYLSDFEFQCDVWAVPEGTPVFPGEPIVVVRGPILQAQLIETMILLTINFQTMIATKANRIVRVAQGRGVMEFGSRRAQSYSAALYGARAAYIGGCEGTSCSMAGKLFGIPLMGTMAHSFIQLFPSEYEAFRAYAESYPDSSTLLIDTYNTLKSGLPNTIRAFHEVLEPMGKRLHGVRIDSGDITYLSRKIRKELDREGMTDCKIVASNSLNEYIISDILRQGAMIDIFGVGECLITSSSDPIFGGVYKLTSILKDGVEQPKIKISENVTKITTPGFKMPWRLYSKDSGSSIADVITLWNENIDDSKPYEIFHPDHTWKRKTVTDFTARPLLTQIFSQGQQTAELPSLNNIREHCQSQVDLLWDEVKRLENPHQYYVDLSQPLWDLKQSMIKKLAGN